MGEGLLILVGFGYVFITLLMSYDIFEHNDYRPLYFIIPLTIVVSYIFYVGLTGTSNPGCVTWHAVGTNARLVGDNSYYGGRWRNNEHWEHDLSYVPEDCDCVTYHWLWGDENNFTQDSVIKGQFKGPTVKPNKLITQDDDDEDEKEEEEDNDFEDEFFQDGVQIKTIINVE